MLHISDIIFRLMNLTQKKLITVTFILAIITLVFNVTLVIVKIALNYSGFNIGLINPGCTTQAYLNAKLAILYIPLSAYTSLALFAVLISAAVMILLIRIYCSLQSTETVAISGESNQNNQQVKVYSEVLYLLASVQVLCVMTNFVGATSLVVDNNSCQIASSSQLFIIMIAAMIAFLGSLAKLVLILVIQYYELQSSPKISHNDIKGSQLVKIEEEQISKHLQKQAKEYMSSHGKEDMMQSLLNRENEIYGNETHNFPNFQNSQNNQFNNLPNQAWGNLKSNQNINTPEKNRQQMNSAEKTGKAQKMKSSTRWNAYGAATNNSQEQGSPNYKMNEEVAQEVELSQDKNKNALYVDQIDNLSEKYDENNFQQNEDLERAIKTDKEEDLSPLELKQLMNFTKNSFELTNNNNHALVLEKKYDVPEKYKITINFNKIKQHKEQLQKDLVQMMKKKEQLDQEDNEKQEREKQKVSSLNDQPISRQIQTLLKVILFNNAPFYKKEKPIEQSQCPISRYVQKDDNFEIMQPNKFKGKNKKIEYSKEQLIFSKKRKENEVETEKTTMRQQFNETEFVKTERLQLFGEQWVKEREKEQLRRRRQQKQPQKHLSNKRKIVEVIRSKFYQ